MPELPLTYVYEAQKYQERARAYASAVGGRRFAVAHQTPGTTIAGQTSFAATTPTFLIHQTGASHRVVLSNFALCQAGAPAIDLIHIAVAIDSSDRYSIGGTSIAPQATAMPSPFSPGFTVRYNPTASAPGSVRYLYEWTQPVWLGSVFNPDLQDGVLIGYTGSILIYTWAATVAPTWVLGGFDLLEDE